MISFKKVDNEMYILIDFNTTYHIFIYTMDEKISKFFS